jgi:hypothetical protein
MCLTLEVKVKGPLEPVQASPMVGEETETQRKRQANSKWFLWSCTLSSRKICNYMINDIVVCNISICHGNKSSGHGNVPAFVTRPTVFSFVWMAELSTLI